MGKKKVAESIQEIQAKPVTPERKKGVSAKPKEAKKPVAKVKNVKPTKATMLTPDEPKAIVIVEKSKASKKAAPQATSPAKDESIAKKLKGLKMQWKAALAKVAELKKAFKKLKKKEGKAKAKANLGANLKTAKIERKTLKKAFKIAKKSLKKAA